MVEIVLPEPDAVPHVAPPLVAHDHVTPVIAAGTVSVIGAFVAVEGPTLATTIVYVIVVPGTALVMPSVFVTERSPRGVTSSVSVAELFAGFVSVVPLDGETVAVLINVAVPAGVVATTVALMVYVTVPPTGSSATVAMFPEPELVPHTPPPAPTQVHVAADNAAGRVSTIEALFAVEGPLFETTIV